MWAGVLQAKEQIGDGLSEGQTEAITRNERQIEKLQEEMLVSRRYTPRHMHASMISHTRMHTHAHRRARTHMHTLI